MIEKPNKQILEIDPLTIDNKGPQIQFQAKITKTLKMDVVPHS